MISEYTDEELTAAIVAALDMVYTRPEVPQDIPGSNVRRGPWRNRYAIIATVAAALVLILAYPAVTAISTGHPARTSARGPVNARLVTSLASLRPVTVDAPHTPSIQSVVLDHHRVTDWVARVTRSGKYVYDLGSARLTDFSAVLPPSDSGLTDPCSWTVRLGGGTPQTYQTRQAANVAMDLVGSGTMTITVAPTQPTSGTASCAMTDPIVQAAPIGTAASSTPEPIASQALTSPPAAASPPPQPQATQQQAQPTPSAAPVTSPPGSPTASPTATSSGSPAPTPTGSPTDAASPTTSATDPPVEPEGGD
jgi:hypothetical protein